MENLTTGASDIVDSGSIVQCDELDKDQNNQHGDFNIYPQCVQLGKMMRMKIQRRNLKTIIVKRRASPHHRVMSLGGACEFREFPDMTHGWTTRGDIRSAELWGK